MIRDGKKQIGALLWSVDLNNDVGVFSLVGHSAQGSATLLGTTVHQIWTVSALRKRQMWTEEQRRPFPLHSSFLRSLPPCHARRPLGQPLSWLSLDPYSFLSRIPPHGVSFFFYLAVCPLWGFLSLCDFAPETYTFPGGRPPLLLGHGNQVTGKCFSDIWPELRFC